MLMNEVEYLKLFKKDLKDVIHKKLIINNPFTMNETIVQ